MARANSKGEITEVIPFKIEELVSASDTYNLSSALLSYSCSLRSVDSLHNIIILLVLSVARLFSWSLYSRNSTIYAALEMVIS